MLYVPNPASFIWNTGAFVSDENRKKALELFHLVKYMESTPGIEAIEKALDEKDIFWKAECQKIWNKCRDAVWQKGKEGV